MTNIDAKSPNFYTSRTVQRAERSLMCSPFQLSLFEKMRSTSVGAGVIAGNLGVKQNYTKRPISELAAENALLWLIQVGVLRREVDGQGITDSFRLTPLGRQIVEQYQGSSLPSPSWSDYFHNTLNRWFRLPF